MGPDALPAVKEEIEKALSISGEGAVAEADAEGEGEAEGNTHGVGAEFQPH